MNHHDHEADMSGPAWQRVASRRRVGDTVTYSIRRHDQGWRAANDKPLDTARGIAVAVALGAACWLAFAVLALWAIELMVTP